MEGTADAAEVQVVPFDVKTLPLVPGATKFPDKAEDPLPRTTLLAVIEDAPVPPSATAKSVIPLIVPPVIATALAFCVDMVPKEPVAVETALVTNAVVAI